MTFGNTIDTDMAPESVPSAPWINETTNDETTRGAARSRTGVRVEVIVYALLFTLVVLLRLGELDTVPMTGFETRQALAAYRAVLSNAAPAERYEADSAIVFLVQATSFALFGASEISARLLTALAGATLVLSPLLFQRQIGKGRALILALLLAFSPTLLIGSRESASVVWAGLFAVGLLWTLLGWNRARLACEPATGRAVAAGLCGAALIALCGASGIVLALIVFTALLATSLTGRADDVPIDLPIPLERAQTAMTRTPIALEIARAFPWGTVLPGALVMVFGAATGFLLYPAGLSAIGNAFATVPSWISSDNATTSTLIVSLFYEPHLWLLGVVALLIMIRRPTTLIDRFFMIAAIVAAIAAVLFGGAPAANALWLTLPLAALASGTIASCFVPDDNPIFAPPPAWGRWVVGLGIIGTLSVFTVALLAVARAMVMAGDGLLSNVTFPGASLVLLLVSTMFIVIGFFLFASLWGTRTTWQGIGVGIALFFGVTSLGSGWAIAVTDADQPAQIWRSETTSRDTLLLRATLLDVIDREARGFTELPVFALVPEDGVVAWVLRDFHQTRFIDDPREAVGEQVVLLSADNPTPDLGTAYVGQDFTVAQTYTANGYLIDFPAWWTQRTVRTPVSSRSRTVLWLRQDVYDGITTEQ